MPIEVEPDSDWSPMSASVVRPRRRTACRAGGHSARSRGTAIVRYTGFCRAPRKPAGATGIMRGGRRHACRGNFSGGGDNASVDRRSPQPLLATFWGGCCARAARHARALLLPFAGRGQATSPAKCVGVLLELTRLQLESNWSPIRVNSSWRKNGVPQPSRAPHTPASLVFGRVRVTSGLQLPHSELPAPPLVSLPPPPIFSYGFLSLSVLHNTTRVLYVYYIGITTRESEYTCRVRGQGLGLRVRGFRFKV